MLPARGEYLSICSINNMLKADKLINTANHRFKMEFNAEAPPAKFLLRISAKILSKILPKKARNRDIHEKKRKTL